MQRTPATVCPAYGLLAVCWQAVQRYTICGARRSDGNRGNYSRFYSQLLWADGIGTSRRGWESGTTVQALCSTRGRMTRRLSTCITSARGLSTRGFSLHDGDLISQNFLSRCLFSRHRSTGGLHTCALPTCKEGRAGLEQTFD